MTSLVGVIAPSLLLIRRIGYFQSQSVLNFVSIHGNQKCLKLKISAFQDVLSTAIGTLSFTGIFYGQKHSRVRVPQTHAVHGAVQRQIRPRDVIAVLRIRRYGGFLTCC